MKLLIDMQSVQGESRNRGIGRLTTELTKAIKESFTGDISFLFNLALSDPKENDSDTIDYIGISTDECEYWLSCDNVNWRDSGNKSRREASEYALRASVLSIKPDIFLVPSLFEGYFDESVTVIVETAEVRTAVFHHDLLPLNDNNAMRIPEFKDYYNTKLASLLEASLILTPSEFTSAETKLLFRNQQEKQPCVLTIGESVAQKFVSIKNKIAHDDTRNIAKSNDGLEFVNDAFRSEGLIAPRNFAYLLVLGVNDFRKGINKCIAAYALLPREIRNRVRIIGIGKVNQEQKNKIAECLDLNGLPSSSLLIIEHVTDRELFQLYCNAISLIFLSNGEGFGLPLLEAFLCDCPVIAGNNTSIPEVCGSDYLGLVDRDNPLEISNLILDIIDKGTGFATSLIEQGQRRLLKFSWDKSAIMALNAFSDIVDDCRFQAQSNTPIIDLKVIDRISLDLNDKEKSRWLLSLAQSQALANPKPLSLFIDISEIVKHDARTGVQRVTRENIYFLLDYCNDFKSAGIDIVFCSATVARQGYFRTVVSRHQNELSYSITDELIIYTNKDIFYGLDLQHDVTLAQSSYLRRMKAFGVRIGFLCHDLLPMQLPNFFHYSTERLHRNWLHLILSFDFVQCVSQTTANLVAEYRESMTRQGSIDKSKCDIFVCLNGVNTKAFDCTSIPFFINQKLREIDFSFPTLLAVGTVEPRKGLTEVVNGFVENVWPNDPKINLLIVGKRGWHASELENRIEALASDGLPVYRITDCGDRDLALLYRKCRALIASSYDEGFGLPLIEAATIGSTPVVARDIPVFREVSTYVNSLFYFVESFNQESVYQLYNSLKPNLAPAYGMANLKVDLEWESCCRSSYAQLLNCAAQKRCPFVFTKYLG